MNYVSVFGDQDPVALTLSVPDQGLSNKGDKVCSNNLKPVGNRIETSHHNQKVTFSADTHLRVCKRARARKQRLIGYLQAGRYCGEGVCASQPR